MIEMNGIDDIRRKDIAIVSLGGIYDVISLSSRVSDSVSLLWILHLFYVRFCGSFGYGD
jgi:hypothetical protein